MKLNEFNRRVLDKYGISLCFEAYTWGDDICKALESGHFPSDVKYGNIVNMQTAYEDYIGLGVQYLMF